MIEYVNKLYDVYPYSYLVSLEMYEYTYQQWLIYDDHVSEHI